MINIARIFRQNQETEYMTVKTESIDCENSIYSLFVLRNTITELLNQWHHHICYFKRKTTKS